MAWLSYERIHEGSGISGKYGETMKIPERWQIRTDSPLTTKLEILVGVSGTIGVTYGTAHPELPALKAMEFDLSPVGRDGMRWILTVQYYVPPPGKEVTVNGIPSDVWERGGGATTVPAFTDRNGQTICNAAGDALEGLSRERPEQSWQLTRCYSTNGALEADVSAADGRINSGTWAGGNAKTWKCYFKGAKGISTSRLNGANDGGTLRYIESQWEFRYDPTTWKLMPWDVGFMELSYIGGAYERRAILGADKKPVKQPVGLTSTGAAMTPGTKPNVINNGQGVDVYAEANFTAIFGSPSILPPGGP